MRRAQREITDAAELEKILREVNLVHLGLYDGEQVYVVPMNYGYRDRALYLHSALEGRKIDILRRNPEVCFTVTLTQEVRPGELACNWSTSFCSVIGYGRATFMETPEAKIEGLTAMMEQFAPGPHQFDEKTTAATAVIRLDITELVGKRN